MHSFLAWIVVWSIAGSNDVKELKFVFSQAANMEVKIVLECYSTLLNLVNHLFPNQRVDWIPIEVRILANHGVWIIVDSVECLLVTESQYEFSLKPFCDFFI